MKKISFYVLQMALLLTILQPQQVVAQAVNTKAQCDALRKQFQDAGGENIISTLPEYCSVGSVYTKFLNLAMYSAGIVAVIAIIYGGYLYMTSAGNETQSKKGKTVLTWAIVGLIVIVLATVIVNVIVNAIVENQFV